MIVKGHRPILALVIEIDEVFYHCSKAFLRSNLWRPETWTDPVPPRPVIAKAFERPEQTLEQLNTYYGEGYANNLY